MHAQGAGRKLVTIMLEVAHHALAGGRQQPAPLPFEVRDGLGITPLGTGSTHGPQITIG